MFYYFNAEMKYREKPPTFANATDAELAEMLAKHYADEIDLSTIEGWEVGATRLIHLDAMQAPNPNSSETWAAQDITVVIVDHNHTDLATPINGHTKAALTVQTRECMNNNTADSNQDGHIYVLGVGDTNTFSPWSSLYMRTFLNSNVYNAFQSDFKSMIKASKHYRHTSYNTSDSEQVTDNIFLPSYPEIFGTASNELYVVTSPTEGTQFDYYANDDASNTRKIKYGNDDGIANSTAQAWWNGSASSYTRYGYSWCCVRYVGLANCSINVNRSALAPAWAM